MPVQFISHHYSNKLGNPGEKQVGMKRFFILCFTPGNTETVLEMVDCLLNIYPDLIGRIPFGRAADRTGIGAQVLLGIHNGESRISCRGRKRLRYVLYEAAVSLVGKNAEFREIHEYYRTRKENPLKKMQSVVAVACKILRIFYTILTKGVEYDPEKLLGDIRRQQVRAA